MSSKENNEVAVEKLDNEKSAEGKCELKGTKRSAEVSWFMFSLIFMIIFCHELCDGGHYEIVYYHILPDCFCNVYLNHLIS